MNLYMCMYVCMYVCLSTDLIMYQSNVLLYVCVCVCAYISDIYVCVRV